MKINRQKNNKGIALIIALIVMMVLFLLGTAYLTAILSEAGIARNQENSEKAFFIAEAGIERALRLLSEGSTLPFSLVENLSDGYYTVVVEDDPVLTGVIRITSTGQVDLAKRILQVKTAMGGNLIYAVFAADTSDPGVVDINCATASGSIDGDVHANGSVSMGGVSVTGTLTQGDLGDPIENPFMIDMDFYKSRATIPLPPGNFEITSSQSGKLIYVEAGATPGIATINCSAKKIKFIHSSVIAEGGIVIIGSKGLQVDEYDDPEYGKLIALGTKTGDIVESGSSVPQDRDVKGIIFSEQGNIDFENIKQQGAIFGQNITIHNQVDIQYKSQRVPGPQSGYIGGISFYEWQENYY